MEPLAKHKYTQKTIANAAEANSTYTAVVPIKAKFKTRVATADTNRENTSIKNNHAPDVPES